MMKRYLLIPALLMLAAPAVAAEADVPPPPEAAAEAPAEAGAADVRESAPNLNEELKAPGRDVAVDVRSYQRKDGATITEYAVRGRVYKIKVQPPGDLPPYYLYDREGNGKFEPQEHGLGKRLSPPTWVLKEF